MAGSVWFKITVGRERKADPKWLLPEICRQGEIEKKDIGAIRVFDRETRFEVAADVAPRFAELVAARKGGGVRIFPAPDGQPSEFGNTPAAEAPVRPAKKQGFAGKPRFDNGRPRPGKKPKPKKPKPGGQA
jgi:ATP-dependent RNA helicase DeaD